MAKRNLPSRTGRDHLSHDLIGQYLFGRLPERTRNRVERHLLDCDFCSDAVDGFNLQPDFTGTAGSMDELHKRLDNRVKRPRFVLPFGFQPYAVAASVILLLTCTFSVWFAIYFFSGKTPSTTMASPAEATTVQPDPAQTAQAEPGSPAGQTPLPEEVHTGTTAQEKDLLSKAGQSAPAAPVPSVAGKPSRNKSSPAPLTAGKTRRESREENLPVDSTALPAGDVGPGISVTGETRIIRGIVRDGSDGEPIPGVHILLKGTQTGTITDTHGSFMLEVPAEKRTLVFSFIGMETEEKETASDEYLQVSLKPDVGALSEVVVVGYGETVRKKEGKNDPLPEGGMDEFNRYLKDNLRHPDSTRRTVAVKLECVVQPDGTLSDFVIRKSAGELYDREAIRALKEGPRWQPASLQGKPVRKKVTLRIPFKP